MKILQICAFALVALQQVSALSCNYEGKIYKICMLANAWSYENGSVCVGISRCVEGGKVVPDPTSPPPTTTTTTPPPTTTTTTPPPTTTTTTPKPTTTTPPPPTTTPTPATPPPIPSSFKWNSTGALIGPKSSSIYCIKDPTVIYYNGKYHVFASKFDTGYGMVYLSFSNWNQASAASHFNMENSAIGRGYRAAPEVFYFAPQKLWYLVFQDGNAAYSTNSDISNPNGWSSIKHFYSGMPTTIKNNIGNGHWVDMYVICDTAYCHLFSSDDNGHLYRSQTSISNFPNGMSEPVIAMTESNKNDLFEASLVYYMGNGKYLLIVECIASGTGLRYFRSWTSSSIAGPWTKLADTPSNPFAGENNVSFPNGKWTRSISHGELVRRNVDQTLTIDICNMEFLYQGLDPNASGDYNKLPWKLGLLTPSSRIC